MPISVLAGAGLRVPEPGGSVPRFLLDRAPAAFRLCAVLAPIALAMGALAQTSSPTVSEYGIFDPPGGQGEPPDGDSEPSSLGRRDATPLGNMTVHGAGQTGFDSTNARRKTQAALAKKKAGQPFARALTTRITPVRPLPSRPGMPVDSLASLTPPYAPPQARPKPKQPAIDPYEPLGIR